MPFPPHHRRHWLEYVATGAALFISAVSLWVAIGTMDANKKMVAAASWPFLQIDTSDGLPDGTQVILFDVTNAGVGPAIVQTFEARLDGKPIRTSPELLTRCCGYDPKKPRPMSVYQPEIGGWTEGTIAQYVIRAGETRQYFRLPGPTGTAGPTASSGMPSPSAAFWRAPAGARCSTNAGMIAFVRSTMSWPNGPAWMRSSK
ncbi:MAG: hypothetical protein ISS15_04190 [Alphaproteobacteria bacterium]|nr:hypothetical protein [Alphaproteobacteria bacterium]MBL6940255.1 hypothetical protein [Alphaproteobacteria bacterium]MBL7096837.1 hypothetical protein [Alphaproteobacteria bacterium]